MSGYDTGGHEGRAAIGHSGDESKAAIWTEGSVQQTPIPTWYWSPEAVPVHFKPDPPVFPSWYLRVAYLLLLSASCMLTLRCPFLSPLAPEDTSRCCSSASRLLPYPGAALAHTRPRQSSPLPRAVPATAGSQPKSQRALADRCQLQFLFREHFTTTSPVPGDVCLHPPSPGCRRPSRPWNGGPPGMVSPGTARSPITPIQHRSAAHGHGCHQPNHVADSARRAEKCHTSLHP